MKNNSEINVKLMKNTFLDLDVVEKVRSNIPVFSQRRNDVYDTVEK